MRSGVVVDDGNAGVNESSTADAKRIKVNMDGPSTGGVRKRLGFRSQSLRVTLSIRETLSAFVGGNDGSLSVVAVRVRREKQATSRTNVGRNSAPCPTRQSALMKVVRRLVGDGRAFSRAGDV